MNGRGRLLEPVLAGVGGAMVALAAAITASGATTDYGWLAAVARGTAVGAPIAVGLYARRRAASRRFGSLLVATGALIFVATLAEAEDVSKRVTATLMFLSGPTQPG